VPDRASAAQADWLKTLVERSKYMEAILQHHLPSLSLKTESLKRASENLSGLASPEEPGPPSTVPETAGSPAAESPLDEVCTIDVINDDVARKLPGGSWPCLVYWSMQVVHVDVLTDNSLDYSGELSHWNFSMRIKRNIDTLMASSQVPVGIMSPLKLP